MNLVVPGAKTGNPSGRSVRVQDGKPLTRWRGKTTIAAKEGGVQMSFGLLRGILPGVVAIALLALSCVSGLLGQAGRASISGVVTDSTRAVAPGVSVTATNTSTNFSVSALTNEVGVYRLPLLPLGPYTVTAKRQGFKIEERAGIVLTAEQAATVDLQISPGTVTEEVKVTANAEMISTATATVSQWIGEKTIVELPLNGRNPASLATLAPGTLSLGSPQSYTTFPGTQGVGANGGRSGSTSYVLDGASNIDSYNQLAAPFPNADATQEFTIETTNPEASRAYTAGATVSIVTKSGTNSWHGNLNSTNATTGVRDSLKRNQFGGSIGGPIKKDKMFIFTNYQATRIRSVVNANRAWVPSDAMLKGDFSGVTKANGGILDSVRDPDTGLPLPNNQISPTRFSPAALKFAASLPGTSEPFGEVWYGGYSGVQSYDEVTTQYDY